MPVYNAADYLTDSIQSVLNQTYSNFELLLIDDGSADNSLSICKEFSKMDSRIVVIHQNNMGVSEARNRGISLSKGQYLYFMDSDDYIEAGMFETIMNLGESADLLVMGYTIDNISCSGNTQVNKVVFPRNYCDMPVDSEKVLSYLPDGILNPVWNKFFMASIVRDRNLRFEPYQIEEDLLFVINYLRFVKCVLFVPYTFYHYVKRNTASLSEKADGHMLQIYMEAHEKLLESYAPYNEKKYIERAMFAQYYNLILKFLRFARLKSGNISDCQKEIKRILMEERVQETFKTYIPVSFKDKIFFTAVKKGYFWTAYFLIQFVKKTK